MYTNRLSSKGQIIIPKPVRAAYHWETGQEFTILDTGDGILIKSKSPFTETQLTDVAGCLPYQGKSKSLDDMDQAIRKGVSGRFQ